MTTYAWHLDAELALRGDDGMKDPVSIETLYDYGVVHVEFNPSTDIHEPGDGMPPFLDRMKRMMKFDAVTEDAPRAAAAADAGDEDWAPHFHTSPEVHIVTKGTLFVDIHSKSAMEVTGDGDEKKASPEAWIRIRVNAGQMVLLMAGVVHRTAVAKSSDGPVSDVHLFEQAKKESYATRYKLDTADEAAKAARSGYIESYLTPLRAGSIPRETVLGPADDGDNVFVHHEESFNAALAKIVRGLRPAKQAEDIAVVYVTGAHNPLSHRSWCPDCWEGDPQVIESVAAIRTLFPGRRVAFAQVSLQRTSFLSHQDNYYRKHRFLQVKSVPWLVVAARGKTDKFDHDADFDTNTTVLWRGPASNAWLMKVHGAEKVKDVLGLKIVETGDAAPRADSAEPPSPPKTPEGTKREEATAAAEEAVAAPSTGPGADYLKKHGVHQVLTKLLAGIVADMPDDPLAVLHEKLGTELTARKKP